MVKVFILSFDVILFPFPVSGGRNWGGMDSQQVLDVALVCAALKYRQLASNV